MIIYLYGEDSYRRNQKLKELVSAYKEKNPATDLLVLDLEDVPDEWSRAKDFLNQPSMFVDSKVLVVKEATRVDEKEWLAALKSNLKTPKTFILISDHNPPKKAFNFLLKDPVKVQAFPELAGEGLDNFISREATGFKIKFSREARNLLRSYIHTSTERSWLTHQELEKISLLNFPEPISLSDLKKAINWTAKEVVFRTVNRFLGPSKFQEKLAYLEKLFLQKEAPAYIFNSLSYRASGRAAVKLADYDISIKSGGLDYEEALTDFLISD